MKNGKSPGTLVHNFVVVVVVFFSCFWQQIGDFVVRALNEAFTERELSATQKQAIITCIPKADKNKDFIFFKSKKKKRKAGDQFLF